MAATAIVLTLQQLLSRGTAHQLPSVIPVNAGDEAPDPIDAVIGKLACIRVPEKPQENLPHRPSLVGTPEEARRRMQVAVLEQQKLKAPIQEGGVGSGSWEKNYHKARAAGYGPGCIKHYADAWHHHLGWVTDPMDAVILRLEGDVDLKSFLRDLSERPEKLQSPTGIGGGLGRVTKRIALSGSFTVGQWDADLVDRILALGRPFFFLPYATGKPLKIPNLPALSNLGYLLEESGDFPIIANPLLPGHDWIRMYEDSLWRRLPHLPRSYRFSVLRIVHELEETCGAICNCLRTMSGAKHQDTTPLLIDLYNLALCGIAISIAALAWHGLGFHPGCPLPKARKILSRLRVQGSLSCRDVYRLGRFKTAEARDDVLARLSAEGLVRVDGKTVTAIPLAEFLNALHTRPEFKLPAPLSAGVVAAKKAS